MQATRKVAALAASRSSSLAALRSGFGNTRISSRLAAPVVLRQPQMPVRGLHHTNRIQQDLHRQPQQHRQASAPPKPLSSKTKPTIKTKGVPPKTAAIPATKPAQARPVQPVSNSTQLPEAASKPVQPTTSATSSDETQLTKTSAASETDVDAAKPAKTLTEKAKELMATAKFLFKFYYSGIKQIWANRKLVKAVQERLAQGGELQSRDEFQLLRTHKSDMKKLPLFVLILVILEEVLPLVVIWAPSLLPSTCVLPSQLIKIRNTAEVKRATACQELRKSQNVMSLVSTQQDKAAETLSALSSEEFALLAKVYSLSSWGGVAMVRRRLDAHLAYLREDDHWLASALPKDIDALAKACSERGLRSADLQPSELTKSLQEWLSHTNSHSTITTLLPLRLYNDASLQDVKSSIEAEKQRGLRAKTKDVVDEVVQEGKKVLSREEAAKQARSPSP